MKISARTEYACIALIELASQYGVGKPVRIRQIAQAHGIPSRFLVQILLQLKSAGLVSSTRGAAGGYRLFRPPEQITLSEIVSVMEGPRKLPSEATNLADSPLAEALQEVWHQADEAQQAVLADVTLATLVERAARRSENMYYI